MIYSVAFYVIKLIYILIPTIQRQGNSISKIQTDKEQEELQDVAAVLNEAKGGTDERLEEQLQRVVPTTEAQPNPPMATGARGQSEPTFIIGTWKGFKAHHAIVPLLIVDSSELWSVRSAEVRVIQKNRKCYVDSVSTNFWVFVASSVFPGQASRNLGKFLLMSLIFKSCNTIVPKFYLISWNSSNLW